MGEKGRRKDGRGGKVREIIMEMEIWGSMGEEMKEGAGGLGWTKGMERTGEGDERWGRKLTL